MSHLENPYHESVNRYGALSAGLLIQRAGQIRRWLVARWLRIIVIAIVFALVCLSYFYFKAPTYSAEISFVLDEQAADNALSEFSDLPYELGLHKSSNPTGSVFGTMNNVVELLRSRLLMEKTLRSRVMIGKKYIVLEDFFLDSLDYRDDWVILPQYKHVDFTRQGEQTDDTTLFANAILGKTYEILLRKLISVDKKGKGTSIVAVNCTSRNESFSKYFVEALMHNTEQYYVETKTQRAKINLSVISKRADSVKILYNSALYGKASFTDANVNPGRQVAVVPGESRQTDITILRAAYIDLARSIELAKTNLARDTPLFQYLDTPVFPLKKNSPPLLIYFCLFFIVGIVLTTSYLLFRKWVQVVAPKPILSDQEWPET